MTEINRDLSSVNRVNFKGNKVAKKTEGAAPVPEEASTKKQVSFTGAYGRADVLMGSKGKVDSTAKCVEKSTVSFMGNPNMAMLKNMEFDLRREEGQLRGAKNPYFYALEETDDSI